MEEKDLELRLEPEKDIMADLDPKLQSIVIALRTGQPIDRSIALVTDEGEAWIDVIAKLKDTSVRIEGLRIQRTIGNIVTGAVESKHIEKVRKDPNVISLKAASSVHPHLDFSIPEIQGTQQQIREAVPLSGSNIDGSGVIVGIVDYGCDFAHENFLNADRTTRLLYLWDQSGGPTGISPEGFDYGREYDAKSVNASLSQTDPYRALGYRPGDSSHGTHVMDIAAGNGRGTGVPGLAPKADIIFVELAAWDYDDEGFLGNSRRLLEAVDYIFTKAAAMGKPAVVNLSLGTHGGPHDGSSLVEQGLDNLLEKSGRAIVVSAGNSWQRQSHSSGTVGSDSSRTLAWQIQAGDMTDNEFEIWYPGSQQMEVTVVTPRQKRLGPVSLGQSQNIRLENRTLGRIIHRATDPNNGDNHINILLDKTLDTGSWKIELRSINGDAVPFHAWIERDDFGQSTFSQQDAVASHTIGSISCGKRTIVVGSYDARDPSHNLSPFSAEGPTRDGRQKPEISAPGHGIIAAKSGSRKGSLPKSGTSMAAPHVTGLAALVFQSAQRDLDIDELRAAVISHARGNPGVGQEWNSRYGLGRVNVISSIQAVLPQVGPSQQVAVMAEPDSSPDLNQQSAFEQFFRMAARSAKQEGVRARIVIEIEH